MGIKDFWRQMSKKLKTTLMYLTSSVLVLGSVSFAAPLFFSQIASANISSLTVNEFTTSNYMTSFGGTFVDPDDNDNVQVSIGGYTSDPAVITVDHSADTWTFSGVALSEGPNLITARAVNSGITATGYVTVDTNGPVISEVTPVPAFTKDATPNYEMSTSESIPGDNDHWIFGGDCYTSINAASPVGSFLIFFSSPLSDGLHDNCTVQVKDAMGNLSNVLNVSPFTVDTTGPSFNPLGFKYWSSINPTELMLDGDLSSGWNLDRDGLATTDYYIDFTDSTIADGNLDTGYHALTLVDMTGGSISMQLIDYYNNRGVPTSPVNFLQYLSEAAFGIKPFAYIKTDGTTHPILIDAAKHDLLGADVPMTIPGDFPEGEYDLTGRIYDFLGNPAILDYKLIVGDITPPVLNEVLVVPTLTNDTTPSYTFNSSEAGDINYTGSCSSATTTAVAGDNIIDFNTLSDGLYDDCQITVTDVSGNVSLALNVSDFTVDSTAPVTSFSLSGGTAGLSDWWKGATPPTVTLSTEGLATIYWRWDDGTWNSGLTDQNPVVSEGVHNLEFYSIDPATNTELPHQTREVKYDGTAPTGSFVINSGAVWTNNTSVNLNLSATDNLSGIGSILAKNAADSVYSGPITYEAVVPWVLRSNEGTKRVDVKYVDVAGNESVMVFDTINLDTTAPLVTGLEIVDTSSLPFINHGAFVMGDVINRVRADVSDSLSGINTGSCEYTLDNGSHWTSGLYNPSTNRCIADLPLLQDARLLSVYVRVKDVAGNTGISSKLETVADSAGPVNGAMVFEPFYQDTMANHVHMTVPMSDTVSGMADCEFRYFFDGSYSPWVGGYWSSTDQACKIDFGGMEHGRIYELQMRGIDNIGHIGEVVSSGFKVVDGEAPDVEYVDPTPVDGLLTGNNTHTFKVETDSDVAVCEIDLGLGDGTFEDGTLNGWSTGGNALWHITTSDVASGMYAAQSGNMWGWNNVQSWISRTVDIPHDTTISFDWKVHSEGGWDYLRFYIDGMQYNAISGYQNWNHQSFFIGAGLHTVTWNYTKDFSVTSGTDSGYIDNISIGGVDFGLFNGEMTNNNDGTWTYGPIALPDGPRSYTVTCSDRVGNTTTTEPRTITIDTTAPVAPNAPDLQAGSDTGYLNTDNITSDRTPTFNMTGLESDSTVTLYANGISIGSFVTPSGDSSYTYTVPNKMSEGSYEITASQTDVVGNISSLSSAMAPNLVIDRTSPEIPTLVSPIDGEAVNTMYPTLDWSDVDGAVTYRFQICYNDPDVDGFCDENRKVTVSSSDRTLINPLSEGDYWWRVRAIDAAGNLSEWSEANKLTIDVTDPISSVDELPEYTNKAKFNLDVTSSDLQGLLQLRGLISLPQGSGVDYLELWYRKDNQPCPVTEEETVPFGSLRLERDECVDGYVRYAVEFDLSLPIEFDTSLTGGDGYYEFFSVAIDKAGNREMYPWDDSADLAAASFLLPFIIDDEMDYIVSDAHTIVDTAKPEIALNGDNEIDLMVGDEYLELGAVWTDLQDGTGDAVVDNSEVDTDVAGSYTVTYNYTDKAGNKADEVSRIVNVEAEPTVATVYGPTEGEVLGDDETNDNNDNTDGEIKGESDVKEDDEQNGFLGLDWYWWLLLIAIAGGSGWWFIVGWKRRKEE